MNLLRSLAAELTPRLDGQYGPGGPTLKRVTVKTSDPRLDRYYPLGLFVTLYTTRSYQFCPPTPGNPQGGMHRAVLVLEVDGDELVVTPHTPIIKKLKSRSACLAEPGFDPVDWVMGIVEEAEGALAQKLGTIQLALS